MTFKSNCSTVNSFCLEGVAMSRKGDDSLAMAIGMAVMVVVGVVVLLWKGGKWAVNQFNAWRLRRAVAEQRVQSSMATKKPIVSVQPQAVSTAPKAEVAAGKIEVAVKQEQRVSPPQRSAWEEHCERIEQAWRSGDYDWARAQLQKIAYSMVDTSASDEERALFKKTMMRFAAEDPLYLEVMARLRPLLVANPGVLQSEIYKGQSDEIKEQMRYVLYFAEALGEVTRKKKGRSYSLYLSSTV